MGEVFALGNGAARPGREVKASESGSANVPSVPNSNGTTDRDRLAAWRREIGIYYGTMKTLSDMEPTEAFISLSQWSARASEIRMQLGTTETKREATFRIRVIDPFIEECDRQFKIHSRIQAIREMDARLAGGSFA